MKILALVGSYRKNGNTDQIVGLISEQLRLIAAQHQEALELETVYLGQQGIGQCRGCRVCFNLGEQKCPLRDDLLAIKAKMKAADAVLIGSPVYVDDVNGITKNWIDRLAHVCHRPEFGGKCAFTVATTGGSPTSHALRTLTMALRLWSFHIVGQAGFKMGALLKPDETRALFQKRAEMIARDLFQAVYQKKYAYPTFLSLLVFKIQQMSWRQVAKQDSVDYRYWKSQGWFDPTCTFFIPHRANPVKTSLARLAGRLMAPFVT
jgi:multimeric flavodoxin WrbA